MVTPPRLRLLGMMLCVVSPYPTGASAPARSSIETAKALIRSGQTGDARLLLQLLSLEDPRSNDVEFLLGLLAVQAADYRQAIRHFRSILVRQPKALRVRLELARAFYLSHDYENAFRQFQFARAGKLPHGVAASIDKYVAAIRREKSWSYNFSFALAPDTNINDGTSSREAIIFGLPFELDEESRQHSGTGVAVAASSEFAPSLGKGVRLRMGSAIERHEYQGKQFDDMTITSYVGPRFMINQWELSALGTGFIRRFGGKLSSEGFGSRFEVVRTGTRTLLSFGLSGLQLRFPGYPLQNGSAFSASAAAVRALTPSTALNGQLRVSRRAAKISELSSWSGWAAAGYYRDLPGGFSVYVEPSYAYTRYDVADPFFGRTRKDRLLEVQVALLNRRILLTRFTPRVAITVGRRRSTVDLYNNSQRRIEMGLTTAF